jgi:methionyl-tRNA formyltransferase
MHDLHDLAFVAAPGFRSRAYAQRMVALGIVPAKALFLPGEEPAWDGERRIETNIRGDGRALVFEPDVSARSTLEKAGVAIENLADADIGGGPCIEVVRSLAQPTILYSGFGGVLLRRSLLSCGKRFLHIHGGYAPTHKGSTAFYFSMLEEGKIAATALWLDEEIDGGAILARRKYAVPPGIEIDRIADPLARADLLAEVLEERVASGRFPEGEKQADRGTTFHVIHPILKHLVLRRCALVGVPTQ